MARATYTSRAATSFEERLSIPEALHSCGEWRAENADAKAVTPPCRASVTSRDTRESRATACEAESFAMPHAARSSGERPSPKPGPAAWARVTRASAAHPSAARPNPIQADLNGIRLVRRTRGAKVPVGISPHRSPSTGRAISRPRRRSIPCAWRIRLPGRGRAFPRRSTWSPDDSCTSRSRCWQAPWRSSPSG